MEHVPAAARRPRRRRGPRTRPARGGGGARAQVAGGPTGGENQVPGGPEKGIIGGGGGGVLAGGGGRHPPPLASAAWASPATPAARSAPAARTAPARALQPGMSGSAVKALQRRLAALKYYPGAIDGRFGTSTLEAVWAFYEVQGLTPHNYVSSA